jgi:Na+/melibiose symporter-like transporter
VQRREARSSGGLLLNRDFMLFWCGESISLLGSQVSLLAFPLTAVLLLRAGTTQTGLLMAAQTSPFLLVSLPAGLLVDRLPRRGILIWSNLVRAALLASVPALAAAGALTLGLLYLVGFLTGSLTVLYAAAYQAYVPALVERSELVAANSRLASSESVAQAAGPPIAGLLAQAATASVGIGLDALSFAVSAFCQLGVQRREKVTARVERASITLELTAGLRVMWRNPLVRVAAVAASHWNFCIGMTQAVIVVFAVRHLGLSPGLFGGVLAIGSIGAVLSAAVSTRVIRRLGIGRTMIGGAVLGSLAPLFFPLARGSALVVGATLACGYFIQGIAGPLCGVTAASMFQHTVAPELLGRVSAARRLISWGAEPIGAVAGGSLATLAGARPALAAAAAVSSVMWLWVALSPWRRILDLADADKELTGIQPSLPNDPARDQLSRTAVRDDPS